MGVTKNDSTMKSEADQAQRKNLEVENQQDKNEKSNTAGKKSNGKDTGTYKERLKEITAVLHKHAITRGVSPEKLRLILTDLGPTFIKLGQIMSMRSDILPKRYCDELMKLMELRKKFQIPGKHPGCKKCPNLGTENCKCRQNVVDASAASPDGDLVSAITAKVLAELKK